MKIERMDPEMVEVLRTKGGAERLTIAFGMFRSARRMLASQLRSEHPDWDGETLQREVSARITGASAREFRRAWSATRAAKDR